MNQQQQGRGEFQKKESLGQAFYHSCLGKIIIAVGVLLVLFIIALLTKPSEKQMSRHTYDDILQCIAANDSIRGDGLDDHINNISNAFTEFTDSASILPEYYEALEKYNRLDIHNHLGFRTAYLHNNLHPQGVRIAIGAFGIVYPTVTYSDLLLRVGVMQKKYKDAKIRQINPGDLDLGANPHIKEFHYKGNPDD